MRDASGRLIGVLGIIGRNITERKRNEAMLFEKEERLALAALHNGVGIWD